MWSIAGWMPSSSPGPSTSRETLATGEGQIDNELMIDTSGREVIVRTSTSVFHDQDRHVLGVLVVLTDITALKRLESQIRRSDRLASLGTLSAGMAHEIKNPLVSIKTFAQLLARALPGLRFPRNVLESDRPRNRPDRFAGQSAPTLRPADQTPAPADARARDSGEVPEPRRPPALSKRN